MRSIIFWIVFAVGYIAFIAWNVYKLRDTAHNPEKYKEVKGYKDYVKSYWHETFPKRNGKNYYASLILVIPSLFLFPALVIALGYFIQMILLLPRGVVPLDSPGVLIGGIVAELLGIAFTQLIIFSINSPIFVAARISFYNGTPYVKAWRNTFLWLLIMGIICLPVMAIGINAYSFADEEKIVTHGIFSVKETQIPYTSVVSGETSYEFDENEEAFSFQYRITLTDGTEVEIANYGVDGAAYIDTMLRQYCVEIQYGSMDADTYELVKTVCSNKTMQFVEQCFSIKTE